MYPAAHKFFDFVNEREVVRLRKEAGDFFPWTDDPILSAYKFTNVRRHHDRTSRELRDQFYKDHFQDDRRSILMNAAIFRYFGTHEFASALGWTSYGQMNPEFFEYIKYLARGRMDRKERVFTGAYVITNQGISAPKEEVVVDYFLKGLHDKTHELCKISATSDSWRQTADEMRKLNGFGGSGFMTKEILMDTTYTGFWSNWTGNSEDGEFSYPFDWNHWTPVGPGARRGVARVLGDDSAKPVKESKAFGVIMNLHEYQEQVNMPALTAELCPHDIQFQLCEFDKYERVRLGQGKPRSVYRGGN